MECGRSFSLKIKLELAFSSLKAELQRLNPGAAGLPSILSRESP
jgi:hypothetical protein